ncbi:hypothetical protein BCR32DRAFT_288018 [Anaeromyces robustus]|uniref:Uncharacterized protein n=1 Tax=Anaeromyces robustus TaxID=1754192 RepID=A0A1Y1VPC9_9FUNG|nr:hypothetical protein BCR32DRAFT_288018 [Anaeromyces robustus]|eukprot:ORX61818.1 hypothetical protein BCR32DRAFT_288018 [Anaeromyces robustus]
MPVVCKRQHILFNKFKTNLSRNVYLKAGISLNKSTSNEFPINRVCGIRQDCPLYLQLYYHRKVLTTNQKFIRISCSQLLFFSIDINNNKEHSRKLQGRR